VGHGIGAALTSKRDIRIFLGPYSEDNKENFNIGRLHFHIQWAFIGFTYWGDDLNKRQKASALAGGPIMSLLLTIIFFLALYLSSSNELRQLFSFIAIFNLIQFIGTIIPITYPQWMGGYNGLPSDGLQLLRLFRTNEKR